jgi:hypothetical protein
MFDTEWLKELKAGDKVIINHGGYGGSKEVALVKRTTKTLIIVASPNGKYEYRFRKSDGFVPGGDIWNHLNIVMHTGELEREININKKRQKIATELKNTNWYNQPLEVLEWVKDTVTNPPPANRG